MFASNSWTVKRNYFKVQPRFKWKSKSIRSDKQLTVKRAQERRQAVFTYWMQSRYQESYGDYIQSQVDSVYFSGCSLIWSTQKGDRLNDSEINMIFFSLSMQHFARKPRVLQAFPPEVQPETH